ncbi:MAG: universal stress protein [Chlorobiaceae bacterium]|nr:universal stress protein [Chlorobiaceae bacterium]
MKRGKKTILCPVDFSPGSEELLQYCSDMYGEDAEIIVLHAANPDTADREMQMKECLHIFSRYSDRLSIHHCDVRFALEYGPAWSVITGFAKKHDVDLIVIGSHGATGLTRLLVGSTAEKVMRKAPCAVMVLRLPEYRSPGIEASRAG